MNTTYKYSLQLYQGKNTRHTCPKCHKKWKFTYYVDEYEKPLAEHVGRCDRENSCGYHYTPAQYFQDNPEAENNQGEDWKKSEAYKTVYKPPEPLPIQYLPRKVMEGSFKHYEQNNFIRFLVKLFGNEKAYELAKAYNLGTSKRWENNGGYSVVFWQVDKEGNTRQAKVMAYNPETGKRRKEEGKNFILFMGKKILGNKEANLQQCLFGEHLLSQRPEATVCLVESEKTAVIMAGIAPEVIWLATGGKNGAKWTDKIVYKALEGRTLILYPDLGAFHEWKERAKILGTVCNYQVSNLVEEKAQGKDFEAGYDIADYFIKTLQTEHNEPQAQKEEEPKPNIPEEEAPLEALKTSQNSPEENESKGLPEGFKVVAVNGGNTLEYQGLPLDWLNENELEEARNKMKGRELEILTALNNNVSRMVELFGLEVEEVINI